VTRAAALLAISPAPGEAFFGAVVARAPAGAETAELSVDGRPAATAAVRGGRARFAVTAAPGPHDLRVSFGAGGRVSRVVRADDAVLLPASALGAAAAPHADPALAAGLTRALASGPRYRAAWVHDLSDGRSAGLGADLAFPAASTVKLGLLAGSLVRLGAAPERSAFAYDLRAMAGFSSNLATNRLLRRLGGTTTAADGLRRLGARASTFPGEYIVGTQTGPPRVSRRVTTARDLGRMLLALHAGAVGAPGARRATGLTPHQARLAVGWLAASEQRGDNASLLAGGLPAGTPIVQKNGWIRAARHGAGIVYGPRGPAVAVVMTYDERGVSLAQGRALGARVAALLR
jgi:beta-lactamase class A